MKQLKAARSVAYSSAVLVVLSEPFDSFLTDFDSIDYFRGVYIMLY